MAKKNDSDSSDEKKRGSSGTKSSASGKKKGAPAKKSGGRPTTRDVQASLTLDALVARGSLIEKSKKPLSYLLDKTQSANSDGVWLCWPDGCVSIDDIGGTPGFIVLIEKSKAGP